MFRILCILLVTGLLASCGDEAQRIEAAERAVPEFHLALIDGDLAGIWQRAAPELQRQESAEAFVARLAAQRRALGGVRGTERSAARREGERVTLRYTSFYEKAQVEEEFVILAPPAGAPRLAGYRLLGGLPGATRP